MQHSDRAHEAPELLKMQTRNKHNVTTKHRMLPRGLSPNGGHRNPTTIGDAPQAAACLAQIAAATPTPARLITKRELSQIVPYTSQHILRLEKKGKFPRRIQVGANRVAWLLSEVEAWIAARVAERDSGDR